MENRLKGHEVCVSYDTQKREERKVVSVGIMTVHFQESQRDVETPDFINNQFERICKLYYTH